MEKCTGSARQRTKTGWKRRTGSPEKEAYDSRRDRSKKNACVKTGIFFCKKNDKYADEVPGGVEPRRERQKSGAGASDFWKRAQEVPDSEQRRGGSGGQEVRSRNPYTPVGTVARKYLQKQVLFFCKKMISMQMKSLGESNHGLSFLYWNRWLISV